MADNHKPAQPGARLIINGKPATSKEAKRILNAPGPKSDKDCLATKPIQTMSRPFSILKK